MRLNARNITIKKGIFYYQKIRWSFLQKRAHKDKDYLIRRVIWTIYSFTGKYLPAIIQKDDSGKAEVDNMKLIMMLFLPGQVPE